MTETVAQSAPPARATVPVILLGRAALPGAARGPQVKAAAPRARAAQGATPFHRPTGGAGGNTVPPSEGGAGGNTVPPIDGGAAGNTIPPSDGGAAGNAVPPNDGSADGNTDGSSDGPMDPPQPDVAGLCTGDGWCWTHPLPTGDRFVKVVGIGADEVWALSASGTIAALSVRTVLGTRCRHRCRCCTRSGVCRLPTSTPAGEGGVCRWDGHSWHPLDMETAPIGISSVYDIWGCGPGNLRAVGILLWHWKDNAWSFPPATGRPPLWEGQTVWGSACNDVFAGGVVPASGDGAIIHWDGKAWSPSAAIPVGKRS